MNTSLSELCQKITNSFFMFFVMMSVLEIVAGMSQIDNTREIKTGQMSLGPKKLVFLWSVEVTELFVLLI